jgi:hypothetical protein
LDASDSVKVSDLLKESFPFASSGVLAVSSVATPSTQVEVSNAFDISGSIANSLPHGESVVLAPSGAFESLLLAGSDTVRFSGQFADSSPLFLSEGLKMSDVVHISEGFKSFGFVTKVFYRSIPLIGSGVVQATAALTLSTGLNETDDLIVSNIYELTGFAAASDEFTASILVGAGANGAKAQSGLSVATPAGAAIGAIAGLGLLVAALVVVMKRRKRDQITDCGMEYETEGKSVEVQCSDSGDEQSEDWDVHDFDDAIESAFDGEGPTQVLCSTSDHFFGSDCDELF